MGKKRIPILSLEQQQALEYTYRHSTIHALRIRCHIILLKHQGRSSKEIALLAGYPTQATINTWLTRYEQDGIEGLKNAPGQGRKNLLDPILHQQKVKEVVQQERQRLSIAKDILEKDLGTKFSKKTLTRFLKRLTEPINASGKL